MEKYLPFDVIITKDIYIYNYLILCGYYISFSISFQTVKIVNCKQKNCVDLYNYFNVPNCNITENNSMIFVTVLYFVIV